MDILFPLTGWMVRMDILAFIIGFVLGVITVGIVVEITLKKSTSEHQTSKTAKTWSISEISNPKIMAEYLSEVDIPKNSKILVNKYRDKNLLAGLNAKEHKGIKGNYIVGEDRALILAGPIKKDEIGFWTVDEKIINQLNREFDEMWSEGTKIEFKDKK